MLKKHRNSQKRIYFEDACYFVTSKTHYNYPYFRERIFCDLFVENLRMCKRLKNFLLYGWVVIYDHIHLLFQPNDEWNISEVMQFLKRHISRNINIVMGYQQFSPSPGDDQHPSPGGDISSSPGGDIGQCRLQNGGMIYKFDIFVLISKIRFTFKYLNQNPFPIFKWQKSFFDEYMRNNTEFNNFLDYIDYNPTKHNLPCGWPYVYTNPEYDDLNDEFL